MIDLHLNKVEHEYSNITIWGAALTILFLVFSFYSIYKMDELIQQGNEGVKDIRRIRWESEQAKEQVEKETKTLQEETRASIQHISARYMRKLINMYDEAKKEKDAVFSSKEQEFKDLISATNALYEQLRKYTDDIDKSENTDNERQEK